MVVTTIPGHTRAYQAYHARRYALDVNIDTLDVLSHKRLLDEARADPSTVSFAVRPVEIVAPACSSPHTTPFEVKMRPGVCTDSPRVAAATQARPLTRPPPPLLGCSCVGWTAKSC